MNRLSGTSVIPYFRLIFANLAFGWARETNFEMFFAYVLPTTFMSGFSNGKGYALKITYCQWRCHVASTMETS